MDSAGVRLYNSNELGSLLPMGNKPTALSCWTPLNTRAVHQAGDRRNDYPENSVDLQLDRSASPCLKFSTLMKS